MARSSKMPEHHITDAADIETLCRLQQQFVRHWNRIESAGNLSDHSPAVAGGAEYSSGLSLGRRWPWPSPRCMAVQGFMKSPRWSAGLLNRKGS
jgi:hypothetical protein